MLFKYEIENLNRSGVVYGMNREAAEKDVRKAYGEYLPGESIGNIRLWAHDNITDNVCEIFAD